VTAEKVVVERSGPVTALRLNREEAANAINVEEALAIAQAVDAAAARAGLEVSDRMLETFRTLWGF
jgi:enoyl-CoA hydratase/carnithine racemase